MPPNEDAQHVKLLSVFHYVMAGLTAVGGAFMGAYFVFVGYIFNTVIPSIPPPPSSGGGPPPPPMPTAGVGQFFGIFGGVMCLFIFGIAVLYFLCGRWLAARRNHSFCFVVGCLSCLSIPLGTVLGVFTIVVLQRPGVRWLFDQQTPGAYLNK